jgi:hypothetical protein
VTSRRAEITVNLIALWFSLVGGGTLLASLAGFAHIGRDIPIGVALIGIAYGVLALATSVLLFRRSSMAPRVFLLWCASFALFIAVLPEIRMAIAIPGYIFGAVLFFAIHRFISRHLGRSRIFPNESQPVSG